MSENNNEEIQPIRKKWTMLKAAKPEIFFNENIFPYFTSANSITNEWGVWSVNASVSPSNTPAWRVFDADDELWWCYRNMAGSDTAQYVELSLDGGYGICPSSISFDVRGKTFSFLGYNPITEEYETLLSGTSSGSSCKAFTYTKAEGSDDSFYTKFKISVKTGYGLIMGISYCKCLKDKIKKL